MNQQCQASSFTEALWSAYGSVSLNDLAKVKLLGTQIRQEDIVHLQNLRNLVLLGLWENSYIGDSLCLALLKFLDIDGLDKLETVKIEEDAMPELEQLWVNRCVSLHDNRNGLSGVQYLPNLNELLLKNVARKKGLIRDIARATSFMASFLFLLASTLACTPLIFGSFFSSVVSGGGGRLLEAAEAISGPSIALAPAAIKPQRNVLQQKRIRH
ncbi:hypothetical protein EJB05_42342, partial [Eragrostis curvula]